MKILIVEDDPSSQKLLLLILAGYGTCDVASNGLEAVGAVEEAIAAGEPYDLACMDIMMPELDGMEALKKIRQMEFGHFREGLRSMKIIMTTAKDEARDITDAFKAGCEAYVTKPINRQKLLEQIRELGLLDEPKPESDSDEPDFGDPNEPNYDNPDAGDESTSDRIVKL